MSKPESVLIYVKHITPRIAYTTKWVFGQLLGYNSLLTTNQLEFTAFLGPKIYYSKVAPENHLDLPFWLRAHDLLFERFINEQDLKCGFINDLFVCFKTSDSSLLPFDVFAAIFYHISRYEEYFPHINDKHGRYCHTQSLAYQYSYLNKLVVERWALLLAESIKKRFNHFEIKKPNYKFIPTIDVDHAYAYKHQPWFMVLKSIAKKIKNSNKQGFIEQISVLLNKKSDPFATYNYLLDSYSSNQLNAIFFILIGNYGKFDKATNWQNAAWQAQIKQLSDKFLVGIHPSYASTEKQGLLTKEIRSLESILNKEITCSRNHFLRISLPKTYQQLIANNISADYSMAYAGTTGFRASTANPFPFYDLEFDQETNLIVYPVCMMDGTYKFYQKLTPDEAIANAYLLIDEIKLCGGTFIPIWHNNSVANYGNWLGWKKVHDCLLQYAVI